MSIQLKLSALPGNQIDSALGALLPSFPLSQPRSAKLGMLEHLIQQGKTTIEEVRSIGLNAVQSSPVMTVSPVGLSTVTEDRVNQIEHEITKLRGHITHATNSALDANELHRRIERVESEVSTKIASIVEQAVNATAEAKELAKLAGQEATKATKEATKIRKELPSLNAREALQSLIEEAFAPFRAEVEAKGKQAEVMAVHDAMPVGTESVDALFAVPLTNRKGEAITTSRYGHPNAPAIDPNFIWTETILRHLVLAEANGENLWFGGEKGTGKSETARQWAGRTGRPFTRINFHKYSEANDYLGTTGIVDGDTVFTPGDFLMAFTTPGSVILLDEPSNCDPGELAPLNGFLEPNSAVSWGGKVWKRAPGVMVFCADNTFGSGDDSGRYAGTRTQNSALIDRFARVIRFDFLPIDDEVDAVVRHTGCDPTLARHVIEAVRVARAEVVKANIVDAPSIRSVMAFIRALPFLSVDEAWATAVTNRQPSESATALEVIRKNCLDDSLINRLS